MEACGDADRRPREAGRGGRLDAAGWKPAETRTGVRVKLGRVGGRMRWEAGGAVFVGAGTLEYTEGESSEGSGAWTTMSRGGS
jgi:hypothetical protein